MKAVVNGALKSPRPEPEDSVAITLGEVRDALDGMTEGKAAGPDGCTRGSSSGSRRQHCWWLFVRLS